MVLVYGFLHYEKLSYFNVQVDTGQTGSKGIFYVSCPHAATHFIFGNWTHMQSRLATRVLVVAPMAFMMTQQGSVNTNV